MAKEKQHLLQNKAFGHFVAVAFYVALGYLLFVAASNMNYIWKWTSVPKYFAYEKTETITASLDGTIKINDLSITIQGRDDSKEVTIDKGFTVSVKNGDSVYENDTIATKSYLQMGPLLEGLIVTLQISGMAAILAFSIGAILALMRISDYQFLKDKNLYQ